MHQKKPDVPNMETTSASSVAKTQIEKIAFDDLKVSTRTVIASTGLEFDICKMYETLQTENESRHVQHVMMKGPEAVPAVFQDLDRIPMRLCALYHKEGWKQAVNFNPKYHKRSDTSRRSFSSSVAANSRNNQTSKKSFRNALNVIYEMHHAKHVNFKVSKNGKFQLTGCKDERYALLCVADLLSKVMEKCPEAVLSPIPPAGVLISLQTVMSNLDFHVGFTVNRQKLDHLVNQTTPYYSLLETSFGYTGVNIKLPVPDGWWDNKTPCFHWKWKEEQHILTYTPLPLLRILSPEALARYKRKGRFNTFLVFHSGKVIMSGMFPETMRPHYDEFVGLVQRFRDDIREQLL